jgi:hypothetical protein
MAGELQILAGEVLVDEEDFHGAELYLNGAESGKNMGVKNIKMLK